MSAPSPALQQAPPPPPNSSSTAPVPNQNSPQKRHRPHRRRAGHTPGSSTNNHTRHETTATSEASTAPAARDSSLALRPASIAPPQSQSQSSSHGESRRGQRGGHRGRGGVGRGTTQHSIVETRQFGGSLTNGRESTPQKDGVALQAHAAEFVPGQEYGQKTKASTASRRAPQAPKQRRDSKSSAPDLGTRIHEDIDFGQYECAICTSEVLRKSKVWSCHTCWTVFHLDCIKKWSSNAESKPLSGQEPTQPHAWRCPGCNLPQEIKPKSYHCWCEKEFEPRSITGIPPHSCGQTCGKSRVVPKSCPHPCEMLCHAGPCPPCTHTGPTQRCFCGKESSTKRCVDTKYESGWSCGRICGDLMPCDEHTCPRECHEGLCGACEVRIDARCYCGKEEKQILCCDKNDEEHSQRSYISEDGTAVSEEWTGLFKCSNICERPFDCGKHLCQKPCHTSDGQTAHCPRSPDVITHCPCGKTPLTEIIDTPRQTCEDSIPNCSKICSKPLACGHPCQQKCHIGECLPCLKQISIDCRCGRTTSTTICHQGTEEPPQCTRICRATLNCGRHECGERCCTGEKKASERHSNRRKQRPLNAPRPVDDGFEAEHICTRVCGRTLKCGNHACQELCHKGPCGACREAIFDEISCHCGRTTLQPPLPCGTKPPPCRYDCERPKPCGHPQVQHNCHQDSEPCPRCPFLMSKDCLCGKRTLKNQQCSFTDVRCGEVCGRKLKCGSHFCRKTCHRPGECEDQVGAGTHLTCTQPCGKPKKSCSHPCEDPCHAPFPCKEDKPCAHKTLITCACQNVKQEVRCSASSTSEGNTNKTIPCNDDCARLERNRKLALALDIDPATHTDDHIPYSTETLRLYQSSELDNKWLVSTEQEFRVFAADDSERRLRFKPMPALQRSFIHSLSEDYGLDSESMDPEPHRHVALFKTPRYVSAPTKTLRDCVRIRQRLARTEMSERLAAHQAKLRSAQDAASNSMRSNVAEEWNGFLLTKARFALTIEELESEVRSAVVSLATSPPPTTSSTETIEAIELISKLKFNIQFLPSGDVALKAQPSGIATSKQLHTALVTLKTPLARLLSTSHSSSGPAGPMGELQLATLDMHLNVLRKESDSSAAAGGGWSQVAAKGAIYGQGGTSTPPRFTPNTYVPPGIGIGKSFSRGGYAILGNSSGRGSTMNGSTTGETDGTKKKKKSAKKSEKKGVPEEEVLDDWADALEDLEEDNNNVTDGETSVKSQDLNLTVPAVDAEVVDDAVQGASNGMPSGATSGAASHVASRAISRAATPDISVVETKGSTDNPELNNRDIDGAATTSLVSNAETLDLISDEAKQESDIAAPALQSN